jgi:hypothetical protein
MRAIVPWLLILAVLPKVSDPWPSSIGIDLPLTMAGGGGVFAGVVYSLAAHEKREHAVKLGGLAGFCLGALLYCIALLNQIASHL